MHQIIVHIADTQFIERSGFLMVSNDNYIKPKEMIRYGTTSILLETL